MLAKATALFESDRISGQLVGRAVRALADQPTSWLEFHPNSAGALRLVDHPSSFLPSTALSTPELHLPHWLNAPGPRKAGSWSSSMVHASRPRRSCAAKSKPSPGARSDSSRSPFPALEPTRDSTAQLPRALRRHWKKSTASLSSKVDLVVAKSFLDYMAWALEAYRNESSVGCIHGYALPIPNLPELYFLRGGDCWGWATRRESWRLFRHDPWELLAEMRDRQLFGSFMQIHGATSLSMLCERAVGRNQSWAILWHASLFLAGRLTLHPGKSLVTNIGNDGSGTHSLSSSRFTAGPHLLGRVLGSTQSRPFILTTQRA